MTVWHFAFSTTEPVLYKQTVIYASGIYRSPQIFSVDERKINYLNPEPFSDKLKLFAGHVIH